MKRTLKARLMLVTLAVLLLLSPICMASNIAVTSADTAVPISDDSQTNAVDNSNSTYQFIESDSYNFGEDVTIDSVIDGNVFACASNITIAGEIGGDVFAFGKNVTIAKGTYIHGSIFVCASDFTMNGICYDIYSFAQNFTLGKNAIVARDIRVGAENLSILGQVKRDAYISSNNISFGESSAKLIVGNLNYTSKNELSIADGIVGGKVNFTQDTDSEEVTFAQKALSFFSSTMSAILYTIVVLLLVTWLAPNFKNNLGTGLKKKAPISLGIGLLGSLVIIAGSFAILLLTGGLCIGISVALITVYILALTVAQSIFAMACGKLVAEKMKKDNLPIFLIMTVIAIVLVKLVGVIPYVGGLLSFLITMTGFGMILVHLIKIGDKKIKTETNSAVENK